MSCYVVHSLATSLLNPTSAKWRTKKWELTILLIDFQVSILFQLDTPHKPKTKVASTMSIQCWIFYKSHRICGPLVKAHFNPESFCTDVTSSDVPVPVPCNVGSCAHLHSVYDVLYMRSSVLFLVRISVSKLTAVTTCKWSTDGLTTDKIKPKYSDINLFQCYFFYYKSYVDCLGRNSGFRGGIRTTPANSVLGLLQRSYGVRVPFVYVPFNVELLYKPPLTWHILRQPINTQARPWILYGERPSVRTQLY